MLRALAERMADRRQELLDAAVRVFARKGFRAARVGDIAEEAGVAHGLLYHYFRSKDEVLETIFRDTWQLLVVETERIEASGMPLREQLRRFARIYLGSWLMTPEVDRRARAGDRAAPHAGDGRRDRRCLPGARADDRSGAVRGEVRADCDATLAAWAVYGALEEILTGWVLGQLPGEEEDVERAIATVVGVASAGLAA